MLYNDCTLKNSLFKDSSQANEEQAFGVCGSIMLKSHLVSCRFQSQNSTLETLTTRSLRLETTYRRLVRKNYQEYKSRLRIDQALNLLIVIQFTKATMTLIIYLFIVLCCSTYTRGHCHQCCHYCFPNQYQIILLFYRPYGIYFYSKDLTSSN